jgi:hypothetical protein
MDAVEGSGRRIDASAARKCKGLMRRIDGTRSPADVHDHIRAVMVTPRTCR